MDPKGTTGTASPETMERKWSGRRDSNPRPTAWKAVTLPLSYSREQAREQAPADPTTANEENGGGGRIRTSVGRSPADLQSAAIVHSATPPKNRVALDQGLEPAPGFEPGTYGLQDRSSTPELCRRVGTQGTRNQQDTPEIQEPGESSRMRGGLASGPRGHPEWIGLKAGNLNRCKLESPHLRVSGFIPGTRQNLRRWSPEV